MFEIFTLAKFLGWGKAALDWLKSLPWYAIALAVLAGVVFWQRHTIATKDARLAQDAKDLAGWSAAHRVDVASIATLQATVADQNKTVDNFKAQASQAQAQAAQARAAAAKAATQRNQAVDLLRRAQAQAIPNDVDAPEAHNQARSQL